MTETLLEYTIHGMFALCALSLALSLLRLFLGPTLADRVVALDMIVILCVAIIALDAILIGQIHFLRVGIAMALVAFLGTVALAFYLGKVDLDE